MPGSRIADPSDWPLGFIESEGGRLAYRRAGGGGRALVLSHGLTDNGLCWGRTAEALVADGFDVVLLDARGHGLSAPVQAGRGDHPAEDIAAVVKALGLAAPIIMGHSVGARASASCVAAHPGLASKLILEDPPLLPLIDVSALETRRTRFRAQVNEFRALSTAEVIARGRNGSPGWHEQEFPAWAAAKHQVDPDAFPVYATPWQDAIRAITVATLLVCGDAALGGLVRPELAEEARALNPHLTVVRIEGAGHNVRRENFPAFLSAVREFLAS